MNAMPSTPTPKRPPGHKRLNQTIDPETHAELKAAAALERVTLQELIERILREWIEGRKKS